MTYDVYALFSEGSYLVASSNDANHGSVFAERVCKELGQWPNAFAVLTRGEASLKGNIFTVADLGVRSK